MDDRMITQPTIDPLRRVFVPIERRNLNGTTALKTNDGTKYVRGLDGAIRRQAPKINGKLAKRIRRETRAAK